MKIFSLSIYCLLVDKHQRASLLSPFFLLFHAHCKFVSLYIHRLNIIIAIVVLRRQLLNEFDGVNEIEPHSCNNDVIDFCERILI